MNILNYIFIVLLNFNIYMLYLITKLYLVILVNLIFISWNTFSYIQLYLSYRILKKKLFLNISHIFCFKLLLQYNGHIAKFNNRRKLKYLINIYIALCIANVREILIWGLVQKCNIFWKVFQVYCDICIIFDC